MAGGVSGLRQWVGSIDPILYDSFVAGLFLKTLLVAGYHSTDFEVHRNWLAITRRLPLREWYTEATSQWTLDYPPFFAWFEYVLGLFAPPAAIRDGVFDIVAEPSYGPAVVLFQRATVMASEVVLLAALNWYICSTPALDGVLATKRARAIAASLFLSPGLLIVDHIHFQYNGMMYGILVASIVAARNGRVLLSALLFAVLLCFKHIYLYLAPAYFAYLLRVCVLDLPPRLQDLRDGGFARLTRLVRWRQTALLAAAVLTPFAVAFGPWVYFGQMPQVLARLFPFSRGLTHAYWAPNVWAIYSFADRVLAQIYRVPVASATRGLVGDTAFAVLPEITPRHTFLLTLFYQLLALVPVFAWPTHARFLGCLTLCGYASYLFGWHVHEKAILLVIFPMSFLALHDRRILAAYVPLVVAGYISLFPLIFTSAEELVKDIYTFVWFVMFMMSFNQLVRVADVRRRVFLLDRFNLFYMAGFVPLMLATALVDRVLPQYEFLRLMAVSVYCSIGIIGSCAAFWWLYFFDDKLWTDEVPATKDR